MAKYEYRCNQCNLKFEKYIPITDSDRKVPCPDCDSETKKLISRFSFVDPTSANRDIDCVIGSDAEKKWNHIHERKAKRDKLRAKKELEKIKSNKKEGN